jgi:hypothetical protein
VIFPLIGPRGVRIVDIEGILEKVVVKIMGHASRKNAFWLISMDRDCSTSKNLRNPICLFFYIYIFFYKS